MLLRACVQLINTLTHDSKHGSWVLAMSVWGHTSLLIREVLRLFNLSQSMPRCVSLELLRMHNLAILVRIRDSSEDISFLERMIITKWSRRLLIRS